MRAGGSGAVAAAVVARWFTPEHLAAHPDVRIEAEHMVAATPPAMLRDIADHIPGARVLVVPRSAHLANAEQPGTITAAIIEHLEQS